MTSLRGTDSFLFLLLSLFIIAASLYLPEHLTIIASRIAYYFSGNEETLASGAQAAKTVHEGALGGGLAGPGRGLMEL